MFEPDILTIGELAARWQQTPQQIVDHARALRVPLYFAFEGLVFDVGDHWHRSTGDYNQTREIEVLSTDIARGEARIKRSARGEVSRWEDALSSDECQKLRAEIEAKKRERTALTELLEQRRIERNRCEYRGYLRAAPSTLWDIATIGAARFPHKAFHPHSPVHIATLPDRSGQVWDGRIVALEPGPGCDRYKKDTLTIDDLHAFMVEVKAIEAHHAARQTAPATDTAPEQNTATTAPVETASDGLAPLTTGDIAHCFQGLRWSESEWRKPLGDKPKWLSACMVIPGQKGVSERRWNPVLIGAALVQQGHVQARSVRAKFQTVDLLKPWLNEWENYEADNYDTP